MTDQEAIAKAQKELDYDNYFAETALHAGLRAVHRNRAEWICRVLRLARKALNIEENLKQPQTNADRIRAMSDEELMQFLFNEVSNNTICSFCVPTMRTKCKCDGHCKNGILEWLKQPAEVKDNG